VLRNTNLHFHYSINKKNPFLFIFYKTFGTTLSKEQIVMSSAGKWKEFIVREDGEEVVPEPRGDQERKKIWYHR
jgi:hypothetical protein